MIVTRGLSCTVFERSSVLGGVWSEGYSNFSLQVQSELYEFPDWPLPEGTPDFTPGPVVQKYLADFADKFDITPYIRFETEVVGIAERDEPGSGWIVTSRAGNEQSQNEFDLVVICIGLYSNHPYMPEFPGQADFGGEVMHISGLRSRDLLAGKQVAVLGYGKSATDAALESAAVAATTHIVIREPHWPLRRRLPGLVPGAQA